MLRYVAFRYATLQYVAPRYVTLRYATLRYVTLRYINYVTLYYVALRCVTLRCVVTLLYALLHHITLHYIIPRKFNIDSRYTKSPAIRNYAMLIAGLLPKQFWKESFHWAESRHCMLKVMPPSGRIKPGLHSTITTVEYMVSSVLKTMSIAVGSRGQNTTANQY